MSGNSLLTFSFSSFLSHSFSPVLLFFSSLIEESTPFVLFISSRFVLFWLIAFFGSYYCSFCFVVVVFVQITFSFLGNRMPIIFYDAMRIHTHTYSHSYKQTHSYLN